MKIVNIFEAKARLSEYLELVALGERVLICRRNQPVAELRAVPSARKEPRPLGGAPIEVPAAFFEELPDEVIGAFYGEPSSATSSAAEAGVAYRQRPRRKGRRS